MKHPNIATIYHLGFVDGMPFYAMELIEGETLEARIQRYERLDVLLALQK
ncbi:MAG: hypothetical protein N2035_04440 [Chthoniobacterales bacterium]|nr:hypothetical protein [Chthoniobacterales bacterium]